MSELAGCSRAGTLQSCIVGQPGLGIAGTEVKLAVGHIQGLWQLTDINKRAV